MHDTEHPTVVLLHSSASSSRQWDELVDTLQPRFRVHAIDLHGHGERRAWPDATALKLADEAALVEPLLAQAGGVHLVGHSYGGAVALKLATLHPRRVLSLVAHEPVLFRWLGVDVQPVLALADAMGESLASGDMHAAAEQFIDFWSGRGTWQAVPSSRRNAIAARMPAVVQQFFALLGEPMPRARVAALGMPMLFTSGARSVPTGLRLAELLQFALPSAQHEAVPGAGHMGPITHAADFNRRIARFLHAQVPSEALIESA